MATAAIRPATPAHAEAIAQVRIEAWRVTYRGMIPDAYLAAMKVEESAAMWLRVLSANADAVCVFVADDAGVVRGFASGNRLAPPKLGLDAELSAIYLAHDYQRSGIGKRLLAAVAGTLQSRGATGLLTWVIAGNRPARTFYEKLGATLLIEQPFQWDGLDLVEAGYGWTDLAALIAACTAAQAMH
jgi:GNAT superfamily N-acetyltransferase